MASAYKASACKQSPRSRRGLPGYWTGRGYQSLLVNRCPGRGRPIRYGRMRWCHKGECQGTMCGATGLALYAALYCDKCDKEYRSQPNVGKTVALPHWLHNRHPLLMPPQAGPLSRFLECCLPSLRRKAGLPHLQSERRCIATGTRHSSRRSSRKRPPAVCR